MGKAPEPLLKRNKKLVALKKLMTFEELAKHFDISPARTKEVYYREIKRVLDKTKQRV